MWQNLSTWQCVSSVHEILPSLISLLMRFYMIQFHFSLIPEWQFCSVDHTFKKCFLVYNLFCFDEGPLVFCLLILKNFVNMCKHVHMKHYCKYVTCHLSLTQECSMHFSSLVTADEDINILAIKVIYSCFMSIHRPSDMADCVHTCAGEFMRGSWLMFNQFSQVLFCSILFGVRVGYRKLTSLWRGE